MKVSVAALTILLIATFCSLASSAPLEKDPPTVCCFSYITQRIPRRFVIDYYNTKSECRQPAIVFIMKNGREICANPSDSWVKEVVTSLEMN
uniref:C-C motif chemokine n=1 Tax=Pelusios castaneus TaxID=367368 RepID=A0A8C8S8L9_9SAUR